jgi:hypothetical protein
VIVDEFGWNDLCRTAKKHVEARVGRACGYVYGEKGWRDVLLYAVYLEETCLEDIFLLLLFSRVPGSLELGFVFRISR